MSLNQITNILGSRRYKLAKNQDTNIQLDVENKSKSLTEYQIIDIVNQNQVFLDEREKSKKYRFSGKFNLYTSNVLSSGSTNYVNGVFTDNAWSPMFYGSPIPKSPNNWLMQITYPSDSLHDYIINARVNNTIISSEAYRGLQYQKLDFTTETNDDYLTVIGIQNHNLEENEYVYVCGLNNTFQGIFQIKNLGINGQDLKKSLTLDVIVDPNTVTSGYGNFIRIVEASVDDLNFNNPSNFLFATATDIDGSPFGTYGTNETRYVKIKTQQPHNLLVNNFVDIRTNTVSLLNGVWRIYNIIGGVDSTEFIIRLNLNVPKGTVITPSTTPKYRLLNGTPSEYYVRKFEVLTSNKYEVYPCAFSSNIYPDVADYKLGVANNVWLFHFNEDVDVSRLKSNRNGPISEVHYGVIKRAGKNPYDWSHVVADWDFNYKSTNVANGLEFISKYNTSGIGSIEKVSGRTEYIDNNGEIQVINGSKYIGDFVDFNSKELKERVISEVIHRFGVNSDANGEGYYYKPFKRLEIRAYSNIIETADAGEIMVDIPENYVTYADGSIAWRDLLTIGYFEENVNGVDYPFLNNAHYFYFNNNVFIRRQNPPPKTSNVDGNRFINPNLINQEC